LRQLYPQIAELRVDIEFEDGSSWAPSAQSFSYFPAARGFFRYSCPCHACSGEFDLTAAVAKLVGGGSRSLRIDIPCEGRRARENEAIACSMRARVSIKAVARKPGGSDES
jgi:hypothetical protein